MDLQPRFREINRSADPVLGGAILNGPKMSLFGFHNFLELRSWKRDMFCIKSLKKALFLALENLFLEIISKEII